MAFFTSWGAWKIGIVPWNVLEKSLNFLYQKEYEPWVPYKFKQGELLGSLSMTFTANGNDYLWFYILFL